MLVRRFTMLCLAVTIFGMAFAILVAEASRSDRRHYRTADTANCLLGPKPFCRAGNPD